MRTTKLRSKLSLLFIALAALIAIPAAVAFADNVQNDVDVLVDSSDSLNGKKVLSVEAGTTSDAVGYRIQATAGDTGDTTGSNAQRCNPDRTPAKATINTSAVNPSTGVKVQDTSGNDLSAPHLTFDGCDANADVESVKFAVGSGVTPGDYLIKVNDIVNDGWTSNDFNENAAEFYLRVTAPQLSPTSLSLSANPTTAYYGDDVALTATLTKSSDSSAISGKTILFKDGTNELCDPDGDTTATGDDCPSTGNDGKATLTVNNLSVGTHSISASFAGDNTYQASNSSAVSVTINPWTFGGFYQPVDMGILNYAKGGSTVPLKFEVFKGSTELTDPAYIVNYFTQKIACASGQGDAIEQYSSGSTSLRYDTTSGQFIFNWKTLKSPGTCYRVTLETKDGSSIYADFQLK